MSYKEFWEDNPYLAVVYRERYKLLREEKNQQMWMQGLYNYIAVCSAVSGFTKSPESYCEKPLPLFSKKKERQKTQKQQIDEIVATLNQWNAMYGDSNK